MQETIERLDEHSVRRPEWKAGIPVVMADGQAWHFPRVCSVYVLDPTSEDGIRQDWNFGSEYVDLLRDLVGKVGRDAVRPELSIYRFLLLKQYDVTDEQLSQILRIDYSNSASEENDAMLESLREIMGGGIPGPKVPETPSVSGPA